MIKKWSLIKDGEIVETITNNDGIFSTVGGRKSGNHTEDWLYACGYLPHVVAEVGTFEVLGAQVILPDKITNEVRSMTQEEIDNYWATKRQEISQDISSTAEEQSDLPRQGYSITEASRWSRDQLAIEAGDWSRFEARAGSYMTGQQYAETRILPKMQAGDAFVDKVIAKRNDLLVELSNTPDDQLDAFDYTSVWDEESDYVPPPIEEVPESAWSSLMDILNYKLW